MDASPVFAAFDAVSFLSAFPFVDEELSFVPSSFLLSSFLLSSFLSSFFLSSSFLSSSFLPSSDVSFTSLARSKAAIASLTCAGVASVSASTSLSLARAAL